ncbi:MAG: hypothetical protein MJ097_02275 [Dorea sp.]|nr:hypothetical protein [Dorea sp.]
MLGLFKKDSYAAFIEAGMKKNNDRSVSDKEILDTSGRTREDWISYYNSLASLRKKVEKLLKSGAMKNTELKKSLEPMTDQKEKTVYESAMARMVEAGIITREKDGHAIVYQLKK